MKILVKLPSRERLSRFQNVLDRCIDLANDNSQIKYLITLDFDCPQLEAYGKYIDTLKKNIDITYLIGRSDNKIHACNRDMFFAKDWDILVLLSDDMVCQVKGWDTLIRKKMIERFPDKDGVLWYFDGYNKVVNTLPIIGRAWYNKFGYIYNPSYTSLWADTELTDVSRIAGKFYYSLQCLFKHEHSVNNKLTAVDPLITKTQSYFMSDRNVYLRRKALNFSE